MYVGHCSVHHLTWGGAEADVHFWLKEASCTICIILPLITKAMIVGRSYHQALYRDYTAMIVPVIEGTTPSAIGCQSFAGFN